MNTASTFAENLKHPDPAAAQEAPIILGAEHEISQGKFNPAREGERWFVCHTRTRCEKKFASLMTAEQMPHYLPLINSVRQYGCRTKRFTKPLFQGYVFALIPLDRKARIYQQELLARAIPVANELRFLEQMRDVWRMVNSGYELMTKPLLAKGRAVRIIAGPLRGLEGFVDDPVNPRGVVIAVDVLQQGLLVKLPAEHLIAID